MSATAQSRAASALLHFGFALTGVVTALLGPLLPWLSARWSLSDAQAGYFFTSQFVGSMLGVAFSGFTVRRFGFRSTVVLGYATLATGVALLGFGTWPIALLPVFIYGVGLGIAIPATNLWISDANPTRRAAALNLLNLSWGLGAIFCPTVLSFFQRTSPVRAFAPLLATVLAAVACALLFLRAATSGQSTGPATIRIRVPASAAIAFFSLGAVFYLYVGTENALAGWIASYAHRVGTPSSSLWLLAPSAFWGALLVGRGIAPVVLRHLTELRVAAAGLLVAAIGSAILIVAPSMAGIFLAAVLAGLGLASVYPIAIAQVSHRFADSAARVASVMFALAGLGGATLPWTVGYVSTRADSLRSGLLVPLGGTLLMLALMVLLSFEAGVSASPQAVSDETHTRAAGI